MESLKRKSQKKVLKGLPVVLFLVGCSRLFNTAHETPYISTEESNHALNGSIFRKQEKLNIVWLMSFPNSGTSYTLLNARETSSICFATNYGDEVIGGSPRPVFQNNLSGPFWHCCQDDKSELCPYKCPVSGFVLTKTHCDGIALGSHWLRSKEDFLEGCLRTETGDPSPSSSSYGLSSVKKAVHLIRNPFDNIVSRFHHERNLYMSRQEKLQYASSPEGFRAYCHDKQDITKWRHHLKSSIAEKLWAHLDGVPCHIDFLRYVIWHNNAFEVLSESNKPTFILHFESYATDWHETVLALLDFLDQSFVERKQCIPFASNKVYREYFSIEERMKVRAAFELFASEQTKIHTKQYFESLPSAEESLLQEGQGKGAFPGPGIVWLMSFPNSGTSYTLRAVRKASSISFATNYGEESTDCQLQSITGADSGPYWPCCQDTEPNVCPFQCPNKGLVLTKTHCTGYQYESIGSISHSSFLEGCLSTTSGMDQLGLYDVGRVKQKVHLIRDPFDNINSRFHHMRINLMSDEERLKYDTSPSGFRAYCREMIDTIEWKVEMPSLAPFVKMAGILEDIPCHVDFIRYILWHNLAFDSHSIENFPTLVLHYETYETDWNTTMSKLLDFLGQAFTSRRNNRLPFVSGKTYRDYFSAYEVLKLKTVFEKVSSEVTWSNVAPYFSDTEIPLPLQVRSHFALD